MNKLCCLLICVGIICGPQMRSGLLSQYICKAGYDYNNNVYYDSAHDFCNFVCDYDDNCVSNIGTTDDHQHAGSITSDLHEAQKGQAEEGAASAQHRSEEDPGTHCLCVRPSEGSGGHGNEDVDSRERRRSSRNDPIASDNKGPTRKILCKAMFSKIVKKKNSQKGGKFLPKRLQTKALRKHQYVTKKVTKVLINKSRIKVFHLWVYRITEVVTRPTGRM